MKQKINILIVTAILLTLLTGCTQNAKRLDDPSILSLDESMKNFFSETELPVTYGKHWQAKVAQIIKVKTETSDYYLYYVLLAPIYKERLALTSVEFMPNDYLRKEYRTSKYPPNNESLIFDFDGAYLMDEMNYKYYAMRAEFCFTNINNSYQQEKGVTDEQFEEYMRNLSIAVKCDYLKKDIIKIHYDGEIAVVSDNTSELYRDREAVREIIDGKRNYRFVIGPYKGELYPISKDIY
ncbi:MAG: hypothetical protein IJL94_01000 [Erysipelotrichaceae bacterium]|nr:hypothetical protein [Erysipelotrichaceae bacterium]